MSFPKIVIQMGSFGQIRKKKRYSASVGRFSGDIFGFTLLTNEEALAVLCSLVKHAGSGRARKKCRGKHET